MGGDNYSFHMVGRGSYSPSPAEELAGKVTGLEERILQLEEKLAYLNEVICKRCKSKLP